MSLASAPSAVLEIKKTSRIDDSTSLIRRLPEKVEGEHYRGGRNHSDLRQARILRRAAFLQPPLGEMMEQKEQQSKPTKPAAYYIGNAIETVAICAVICFVFWLFYGHH